jgi:hypothetical protein
VSGSKKLPDNSADFSAVNNLGEQSQSAVKVDDSHLDASAVEDANKGSVDAKDIKLEEGKGSE